MSYNRNDRYFKKAKSGYRFSTQSQRFENDNSKGENFEYSRNRSYATQESRYENDKYRKAENYRHNRKNTSYRIQENRYEKDKYRKSQNKNNRKNSCSTQETQRNRRIGQTFCETDMHKNNSNYQGAYKRRGYYNKSYRGVNFNSQKYRYFRSQNNEVNDVNKTSNEKDVISTNRTPNDLTLVQKELRHSNGDLTNSFVVDPLPKPVEDTCSTQYICKNNLEFPGLDLATNSVKQSSYSTDSRTNIRKRHFSQSSSLSQKPQVPRKRNASVTSLDSDSQKKFKNDLFGEEFEIFEKSHLKDEKGIDDLSSQPQSQVQSESGVKEEIQLNWGLDHVHNDDLSQSQTFTPFSIPCGQANIKNTDEAECSTQESKISLSNFILDHHLSQCSQTYNEGLKSENENTTITDPNNSPFKSPTNNPVSHTNIGKLSDISYDTRKTHPINNIDKLLSVIPSQKDQKAEIPVGSQDLCNESELIASSQECEGAVNVLPNIISLKNLSKSMSDKKSLCSTPQNTGDCLSAGNEKSLDLCELSTTFTKESNNLNKSCSNKNTLNPLTSTQYGPRKRNLYNPQLSPLTGCIRNFEIENSSLNELNHLDSSPMLRNENQHKNSDVSPSTQPFENLGINTTISGNNFEILKLKMEQLFDIPDSQNEIGKNLLEDTSNKNTVSSLRVDESNKENSVTVNDVIPVSMETIHDRYEIVDLSLDSDENGVDVDSNPGNAESVKMLVCDNEISSLKNNKNYNNINNNNSNCEGREKLDEAKSQNSANMHQEVSYKVKKETRKSRNENRNGVCEDNKEQDPNLSLPKQNKKELCVDFDSKVGSVLKILKNLFEEKKEKYLSQNIPTTFKFKVTNVEGSDLNIEKKMFKLPDLKDTRNVGQQNPQNIVKIFMKSSSYIEHTSLKSTNSFTHVPYSDDEHSCKVKKQEKKSFDKKDNDTVKKNKKTKIKKKSFLQKDNWWENVVTDLPNCVLEASSKVIDDLCDGSSSGEDANIDNVSDDQNNSKIEIEEDSEGDKSETVNSKSPIAKKKKKKLKKEKHLVNNSEKISNSAPVVDLDVPSNEIPPKTKNTKVKKKKKQHQICLDELSMCDDPALSNVKKTLKKKYKKSKGSSHKSLTPPFKFKKIKSKPGTKRALLNNENKVNLS